MKTYTWSLVMHIVGLVLFVAGGVLAVFGQLWFCLTVCVLVVAGISYNLYRVQMKQVEMMQRIVEGVKRSDFSQLPYPVFRNRAMNELAEEWTAVLKQIRERITEGEVRLQYYENLLDKVDTAVVVVNGKGMNDWMNRAARNLFGDVPQLPEEVWKAVIQKASVVHLKTNSSPADLALSATQIQLQGHDCYIVSLKNIHGVLERNEMEAWQKLIRVLTHEIMNSISPIISLAETLSERTREPETDEHLQEHISQGLQVIHRRSKGLLEFVENYRKLTRIATPVKRPIAVSAFFHDLRRLFPDKAIHFGDVPETCVVQADRAQLEQVFINLLKNAQEACADISSPKIEVTATSHERSVTFMVNDNGEGIMPEVAERIFVPFFTTKSGGSGIGLSLCRQIVTLHGGNIRVESEPGKGSRFVFVIPG
ncbi:ATP-binding protein [uncultured Bacteroides sp.]|uniref:sensor histidine kinase n=1 Tax=uncultured Bacteroides sp. TaxID=162156 RepID=UPI00262502DA|nr:ATP-binding protein [uncultured Bacteroides sp.]